MLIYFDNSATTSPDKKVCDAVARAMAETYGNPSSLHRMGKAAEDLVEKSRQSVAKSMGAQSEEIIFTSGGTESDNLAIIGYCRANRRKGNKVITSKTEHPAVLESFKQLESEGFDVFYLDVDESGVADVCQLKTLLDEDTLLVSIMHANNETGTIQPIEEIAAAVHSVGAVLHVDSVQSYGKIRIDVKKLGADILSVSAHKVNGPKGVGALYVKKGIRIHPTVYGGGQEKGLRSSTENVPAIAGFGVAAESICADIDSKISAMDVVKQYLKNNVTARIENVRINTPENSVCGVLNVSFTGVKSEVLLHVLEDKGIYVSSGSACSSHKKGRSYVLQAMGVKDKDIDSAIRFSFCGDNTVEEAEAVLEVLTEQIPLLRKIMR